MKAIILGTGPSLKDQAEHVKRLREDGYLVFGVNNTYNDFELDVWIACDPKWHAIYSPVSSPLDRWHWDKGICEKYGYMYVEGRWGDGLSTDQNYIHYGHSSGYQALGLAVHYGCKYIYLCGFDMHYNGSRHYFDNLSNDSGEYPQALRKYSTFDGLIKQYETIPEVNPELNIFNCTKDSALTCFPYQDIGDL